MVCSILCVLQWFFMHCSRDIFMINFYKVHTHVLHQSISWWLFSTVVARNSDVLGLNPYRVWCLSSRLCICSTQNCWNVGGCAVLLIALCTLKNSLKSSDKSIYSHLWASYYFPSYYSVCMEYFQLIYTENIHNGFPWKLEANIETLCSKKSSCIQKCMGIIQHWEGSPGLLDVALNSKTTASVNLLRDSW